MLAKFSAFIFYFSAILYLVIFLLRVPIYGKWSSTGGSTTRLVLVFLLFNVFYLLSGAGRSKPRLDSYETKLPTFFLFLLVVAAKSSSFSGFSAGKYSCERLRVIPPPTLLEILVRMDGEWFRVG